MTRGFTYPQGKTDARLFDAFVNPNGWPHKASGDKQPLQSAKEKKQKHHNKRGQNPSGPRKAIRKQDTNASTDPEKQEDFRARRNHKSRHER